jgi:hypothetical protein
VFALTSSIRTLWGRGKTVHDQRLAAGAGPVPGRVIHGHMDVPDAAAQVGSKKRGRPGFLLERPKAIAHTGYRDHSPSADITGSPYTFRALAPTWR